MIALDTNILVYAHRQEFPEHEAARRLLFELAEGPDLWGLPVFCIGEFLRVVTHPRLLTPPSPLAVATGDLELLLESGSVRVLAPGERFASLLLEVVREAKATGNLIFDAQIVALCREHGVETLLTDDRDLLRFPAIRVRPLTG